MRVEFLLEEESMKYALEILLPKILPPSYKVGENCFLRPHNGKSDLKNSIPKKVKVFSHFHEEVKLVICHFTWPRFKRLQSLEERVEKTLQRQRRLSRLDSHSVSWVGSMVFRWYEGDWASLSEVQRKQISKQRKIQKPWPLPSIFGIEENNSDLSERYCRQRNPEVYVDWTQYFRKF